MSDSILLPFQPDAMTPARLAAVSYLARYSGHTHTLYAYQLRRWFAWCRTGGLDPLVGMTSPAPATGTAPIPAT
jgi:integrase/recombinase XerD